MDQKYKQIEISPERNSQHDSDLFENREDALAGLGNGRWSIRMQAVIRLHDEADEATLLAILPLTRDPKRQVRQVATYAVGCARKTGGLPDAVPILIERVCSDTSIRMRRFALQILAFQHAHGDLCGFFQHLLDTEHDAKLHRTAGIGLWLSRQSAAVLPSREAGQL